MKTWRTLSQEIRRQCMESPSSEGHECRFRRCSTIYLEGDETLENFLQGFPTVSRALALEALEEAKQLLLARG